MTLGLNGKLTKVCIQVYSYTVLSNTCSVCDKKKTSIKRDNLMYSEKMIRVSPTDPSH